jgi:hypothetical protein
MSKPPSMAGLANMTDAGGRVTVTSAIRSRSRPARRRGRAPRAVRRWWPYGLVRAWPRERDASAP